MTRQASRTGKEKSIKAITAANKQPTPTSPTASCHSQVTLEIARVLMARGFLALGVTLI
jgi:hypothetical protein